MLFYLDLKALDAKYLLSDGEYIPFSSVVGEVKGLRIVDIASRRALDPGCESIHRAGLPFNCSSLKASSFNIYSERGNLFAINDLCRRRSPCRAGSIIPFGFPPIKSGHVVK